MPSRALGFKKNLAFYKHNFNIQAPYHLIVDGGFIRTCIDKQLPPKRLVGKLLAAEVHLCLLSCVEQDAQIKDLFPTWGDHHKFERIECDHPPMRPNRCIHKFLSAHPLEYCACLSESLGKKVADTLFSVPIVYFNSTNVLMLAQPSKKAQDSVTKEKEKLLQVAPKLLPLIQQADKELHPPPEPEYHAPTQIKKKAKGPNPLSVKKKKRPQPQKKPQPEATEEGSEGAELKKKRKRKHKRSGTQNTEATSQEEPPLKKQKQESKGAISENEASQEEFSE